MFPSEWIDRHIIFIEPHCDDFLLNAYSLLKTVKARNADPKPAALTVVSVSASPVNNQNGLRAILNKYSLLKINLIELGLPDITFDRATKDAFKAAWGTDFAEAPDEFIIADYTHFTKLTKVMTRLIDMYSELDGAVPIILIPLGDSYSHPFHRLVSAMLEGRYIDNTWYYQDNPYFISNNGNDDGYRKYVNQLADTDLAMKFSLFVQNYEHQVQAQVVWNNAWMLHSDKETFYKAE